jgi:flagellar protein FlbD
MFPRLPADIVRGVSMIRLTRFNHAQMVLNSDLIEHIDVTPDTVITLTTGQILRVLETAEEVIERIVRFRRRIFGPGCELCGDAAGEPGGAIAEEAAQEASEARE